MQKTRKVVKTLKDKKKLSCASIYKALIYVLPGVLCLSFYPVIKLGSSESMNYELSLPLIWLAIFDVVTLVMMIQKKRLIGGFSKKLVWLLFPGFLTISVLWSLNFTRGLLTVGILWLICFAVYGMWELRSVLKEKRFKDRFWKVFFGSYLVVCVWCVVQCIMDLEGVSREARLMCAGCTYRMFGFPHPNGFAIEPQFMGNLLLAPAIVSAWKAMDRKKYLILFFIFSVGIFLTFSRGAIYAFVVAMIFMMAMERVRRKVWGVCKIFFVIAVAFVFTLNLQGAMAAMSPTNDTYVSGVAKVLNHLSLGIIDIRGTEENGGEAATVEEAQSDEPETPSDNEGERAVFDGYVEESTDTRVKLSGAAIEVWRKDPKAILVGVGLGGAGQALYVNGLSSSPKEIVQNEYASLLLETGLIGVILIILTLVLIIRVMQKSMAMPMLLTMLVAYGITLMFFSGLPNALHIYLLTGLFVALSCNLALNNK